MPAPLKRLRRWLQNPSFYAAQAKRRLIGEDTGFLMGNRDDFPIGSRQWLALSEQRYGGVQLSVRDRERLARGEKISGVQGGDRMTPLYHDYGRTYAEFLQPYVARQQRLILAEMGILNGTGLAIWCDLFPAGRVVGFDLDVSNFHSSDAGLRNAGAFAHNQPEVHCFDQLDQSIGSAKLAECFQPASVDVVIDDGAHTLESIESTFAMMEPFLAPAVVYFIEDNYDAYDLLRGKFPGYQWKSRGQLTVCRSPKRSER